MSAAGPRAGVMDVISLLKAQGLRATSARVALLHSLNELGYATAEQLHAAVVSQLSSVSPSTVYRTLESLTEHHLVRHAHLVGAAPSYYLARGPEHAHLVCSRCGTVENLSGSILEHLIDDLASSAKFVVNTSHLSVEGLCEQCQQLTPTPPPPASNRDRSSARSAIADCEPLLQPMTANPPKKQ